MTSAGWYPDPAGQPGTYRYWDGQSWSQQTTANPASPPPGAPPYQPYGQPSAPSTPSAPPTQPGYPQQGGPYSPYGQPGQPGQVPGAYGVAPPPPSGGTGGRGKVVAIVAAAVVLLAALGTGAFLLVRSLADDGDDTASDDTSAPASTEATPSEPTPSETGDSDAIPSPTEEESSDGGTGTLGSACTGGAPDPGRVDPSASTLTGGGLRIPSLVDQGYTVEPAVSLAFTWADSYQASYKVIESAGEGWIANYGVGGLAKENGFDSPQQAAETVLECMTSSDMYQGFTGTTDLQVGPVRVDGHDAYSILTEVRVDNPDVTAEGDVAQVVVVDTGDPGSYGLYISVVPIGDQKEINRQARVLKQIEVP